MLLESPRRAGALLPYFPVLFTPGFPVGFKSHGAPCSEIASVCCQREKP